MLTKTLEMVIFTMGEKGDCIVTLFGCFSPPTNGHICMLGMAADHLTNSGYHVVKAIMIPAHGGYSKPGLIPVNYRVEMCRLATEHSGFIEVETFEAEKNSWTRTIDTLTYLREKYPGIRIFFACGVDTVEQFETKWREPDVIRIIEEFGLIVFPRTGFGEDIENKSKFLSGRMEHVHLAGENPMAEVSSSLVRDAIVQGRHTTGLIPHEVNDYINLHRLYTEINTTTESVQ